MRIEKFDVLRDFNEYLSERRGTWASRTMWCLGLIGCVGTFVTTGLPEALLAGVALGGWGIWIGMVVNDFKKWRNGL